MIFVQGFCYENDAGNLKSAKRLAKKFKSRNKQLRVEIYRADRNGMTNYCELIEII